MRRKRGGRTDSTFRRIAAERRRSRPAHRYRTGLRLGALSHLATSYGLRQEFTLPDTPEENGVAESFMGTLKPEYLWQQRFDAYDEAKAATTAPGRTRQQNTPHSQ